MIEPKIVKIVTVYELHVYELFEEVVKNLNDCSRLNQLPEKPKVNRQPHTNSKANLYASDIKASHQSLRLEIDSSICATFRK